MDEITRKYLQYLQKLGQSNDPNVHERGFIANIVLYGYSSKEKKHENESLLPMPKR